MTNKTLSLLSFIALLVAAVALYFAVSARPSSIQVARVTANDSVMKNGVIRCAYILYPPYLEKDLKTGQLQGIGYELVELIGKTLNKKIEWKYEINPGDEVIAFERGGVDSVCAATGAYEADLYGRISYSDRIFVVTNFIYARADDDRFNGVMPLAKIGSSGASFIGLDGDTTSIFPKMVPNAKVLSLPSSASTAQLFQEVKYRKADLVMMEGPVGNLAVSANPGVFKIVNVPEVLPTYGLQMAFDKRDADFKETVNEAIRFLKLNGQIDKILTAYDPTGKIIIRAE